MTDLEFRVLGHPQPGGSKRAFPIRRAGQLTGHVAVTDSNPRAKDWAALVIAAAFDAANGRQDLPFTGPLSLAVEFTLKRPAGHYGSGRNHQQLKPSAPRLPSVRPDITKLLRVLEDALTGIAWRDDAQIVTQLALKNYGHPEGAHIKITRIDQGGEP
jgi:Holliday junction resolvase RusA-like endonuclease